MEAIRERELAITEDELHRGASVGQYYDREQHAWQSMGWLEWVFREYIAFLFCFCCVDSGREACLKRSWEAVTQLDAVPTEIANRIESLFFDALMPTNPRNHPCVDALALIFSKIRAHSRVEIQQHMRKRSFNIFQNQELLYRVASSAYGYLDFYQNDQRIFRNTYDSLWGAGDQNRLCATKLAVDYPQLSSAVEILDQHDRPVIKIQATPSKQSLIFRLATTNQILAVASNSQHQRRTNWSISLFDQAVQDDVIFLVLGALKYSQHYYFPNPADVPYVEGIPLE